MPGNKYGLEKIFRDFFDRGNNHFYARRYLDMEFVLSLIFIIGFTQRPREKTSQTAQTLLAFAILRICSSSLVTLKTFGAKILNPKKSDDKQEEDPVKFWNNAEIALDVASAIAALFYFFHFWDTYWDGYNAPLPENEPCRGVLYCSTATVLKYYVAIGILYYLALFTINVLITAVRKLLRNNPECPQQPGP
jgi:hypothetical protein